MTKVGMRSDCPACGHGWEVHEPGLPRLLFCLDCGCQATVKWRHAWVVWLLWTGNRLLRYAQRDGVGN